LHEPVAPIVTLVGLRVGVNEQVPVFDHVFTPGEFVDTTADNFRTSPAISDETFHVTFVDGAATTEPPTVVPTKRTTTSNAPTDLREQDLEVDIKFILLRIPTQPCNHKHLRHKG